MTNRPSGRARLAGAYIVLVGLLTAVAIVVLAAGEQREPQQPVAGGYAVVDGQACLGSTFQLAPSGRSVGLANAAGTLGGKLELDDGRLTGDVECVRDPGGTLDATVEGGRVRGTLDGRQPVIAELTSDPSEIATRLALMVNLLR